MSTRSMTACVLLCDGCDTALGADGRFRSAMEARAAAYGEGWRFPNGLNKSGSQSARSHDVCPDCLPTWTVRVLEAVGPNSLRIEQAEQLRAEQEARSPR